MTDDNKRTTRTNETRLYKEKNQMKEDYIIRDQEKAHFITTKVVDWIDVFTRKEYRDVVINSLDYCIKNKDMLLYGYVIMSNHVHMIVQSKNGKPSDLIRDFKKFTARSILEKIMEEPESRKEWMLERFKDETKTHSRNRNYQFWHYGNHAEEIYSEKFLWSKLDYIHLNPVRSGIVKKASDYLYSSATNYIDGKGILENIELASNPVIDVLRSSSFLKYE